MDIVTYVLAKNSANSAISSAIAALPKTLNKTTETWTFVLADNTTVNKTIVTDVTLT